MFRRVNTLRMWVLTVATVLACSASALVGAAFDFQTVKITNKTGKAADDLKLTFDRVTFGGRATPLTDQPTLAGKTVTYTGPPVGNNADATTITIFNTADGAKNTSLKAAEWSFPDPDGQGPLPKPPNQPAPTPDIEVKDGKKQGNSVDGFMDFTNEDTVPIYVSNFRIARDVPASFFGSSDSQLDALIANDLFIGQGTQVSFPSSFTLQPNEVRTFDLGEVTEDGYLVTLFDAGFSPTAPPDITIGHASVPEPRAYVFLAIGILCLLAYASRLQRKGHCSAID